jgi:hypothetical protein
MTRLLERAWVPLVMVIVADFQSSAWWPARGEHAQLVLLLTASRRENETAGNELN